MMMSPSFKFFNFGGVGQPVSDGIALGKSTAPALKADLQQGIGIADKAIGDATANASVLTDVLSTLKLKVGSWSGRQGNTTGGTGLVSRLD
jgi:hypothetical protein